MTLLTPLGLLGLLGIVVLIIIYIIRPNYQQKFISSTYIWKLSLKYRKKKIPINKLRNILLIICQILAITAAAMILAQPNNILKEEIKEPEIIAIIDSSASMRTTINEQTRFCRAIGKVQELAEKTFDDSGIVSVIVADEAPSYLQLRATSSDKEALETKLSDLFQDDNACSYATANVDGAIALCEEVLYENPDAKIYLYTDTNYSYVPKEVSLVNVSEKEEWNASILSAKSQFEEPYYAFVVEMACYGQDRVIDLHLEISGANAMNSEEEAESFSFTQSVDCIGDKTMQVIFAANPYDEEKNEDEYKDYKDRLESSYSVVCWMGKNKVFSYRSVNISIDEPDCFTIDNTFELYDGLREVLKVQYASEKPNIFWPAALSQLTKTYEGIWDIDVTEVKKGDEPSLQGFDLYIFEHTIPEELPTDGIVFLMNPDQVAAKYGVRVGAIYSTSGRGISPEEGELHPITNNVVLDRINITRFTQLILDSSYTPLFGHKQYPLLAVRNEEDVKIVVMPFSLHYSDIAVTEVFPLLVYNVFEYFFPQTVKSNSFEVNERVELNARGTELAVEGYQFNQVFTSFPAYITVDKPGTYVMSQTTFAGKDIVERIYVRIPKDECNIKRTEDAIVDPYRVVDDSEFLQDLLVYIAAGLVALLFIEWWLKSRESA